MKYTVRDDPVIVARIEHDLLEVVRTVRDADPALRSIVLTGGFARGEGAVRQGAPQNDYDFVAVRGFGRPTRPYEEVAAELARRLGLHVDLAPVQAWRLRVVGGTIFWYETALRGRVLWGEDLLGRIGVRQARDLDPKESMRLLVNRAAGLLLVTEDRDPDAWRLQAAKALLAVADAHMLAAGEFAPSQTERWRLLAVMRAASRVSPRLDNLMPWIGWAWRYKVDPDAAEVRDPLVAWRTAARAVIATLPVALRTARLSSLESYAARDGVADHVVYFRRAGAIEGARRIVANPTGNVRLATIRLLEASLDGHVESRDAQRWLGTLAPVGDRPLRALDSLRHATLQ